MNVERDYTLTRDAAGRMVAHRIDCAVVALHRASGQPLVTMFSCERPLPADVIRHQCLDADKRP